MTENIIIAILLFATFATLLILLISNRRMRKNSDQPTLRELERQYKKLETDETVQRPQPNVIDMRAIRVLASTIVSTISRITLFIFNNGTSPCTINRINIEPEKMDNLYMDKEEFRRCS